MNTGHIHPPAIAPILSHPVNCRFILLFGLGCLSLLGAGCFRPSTPVQTLRDSVHRATGEAWQSEIELGLGAFTLGLARAGGTMFELPPEARVVLRSVRGADVGVYRLRDPDRKISGATVLPAADRALDPSGWDRLVGVIDGPDKVVAVYVSREPEWSRRMKLCVVVIEGPQMVIVSVRGNPEPLLELALAQTELASGRAQQSAF